MSGDELKSIASKLSINSPHVIRKALEYQQLMDVRANSTTMAALKLTGSCLSVLCLDLAASSSTHSINRTEAIKFAGVNKKMYTNLLKTVESMLDLQENLTIKEMAVRFGCTGSVNLAERILKSYEKDYQSKSCVDMDFTSPLFQAASLWTACRKQKVKVDKSKLYEVSSVKKTTFDRLTGELETHADNILAAKNIVEKRKTRTFLEEIENRLQEGVSDVKQRKQDDKKESFEDWKKKILANAEKAEQS